MAVVPFEPIVSRLLSWTLACCFANVVYYTYIATAEYYHVDISPTIPVNLRLQ